MKQIIVILTLVLGLATMSYGTEFGITGHFSPTASMFVKGNTKWTYVNDEVSVGLYYAFKLDEMRIIIKDRLIVTMSGEEFEDSSVLVATGNVAEVKLNIRDMFLINYSFLIPIQNDKAPVVYGMGMESSHRLTLDLNLPLFGKKQ